MDGSTAQWKAGGIYGPTVGASQSGGKPCRGAARGREEKRGDWMGGEKEAGRGWGPSVEAWRKEEAFHSFLQSNGRGREPAQCDGRARAASAQV